MLLASINHIPENISVVLLYTPSEEMEVFVYERLKKRLNCSREYIKEIKRVKDMREAEVNGTITPFGSSCWIFKIGLDKQEKIIKDLKKNLDSNRTGVYYLITSKYYLYKNTLEALKDYRLIDYNMGYLKKEDIVYIYDSLVPKDKKVKSELFSFFAENYSSDVEAMFKFFNALQYGEKFDTKKQIVNLCGMAGNTIPLFTLNLIQSKLNSDSARDKKDLTSEKIRMSVDRGRKTIIKNKITQVKDMLEIYDWRYIYVVVLNTIKALCDLKILYINGSLYKRSLDRDEIVGYDEKQIARGMKYWYKIHELPMSELLLIRTEVERRVWSDDMDFEMFLYTLYR